MNAKRMNEHPWAVVGKRAGRGGKTKRVKDCGGMLVQAARGHRDGRTTSGSRAVDGEAFLARPNLACAGREPSKTRVSRSHICDRQKVRGGPRLSGLTATRDTSDGVGARNRRAISAALPIATAT